MATGFFGGAADAMQQNTALQGQMAFRMADLGMKVQQYQLELAKLNHQTSKEQLDYETNNLNAMVGSVKGMLEKAGDVATADKSSWGAITSGLASQVAKLAGTYANTHGGSFEANYERLMNVVTNQVMSTASTTPGAVATNKAFADTLEQVAAHKFNLPQLVGQNKAIQDTAQTQTGNALGLPQAQGAAALGKAQGGGAAAAALTTAATESQIPRVMTPEQGIKYPTSPLMAGSPALVSPTQTPVAPVPPALTTGLPQGTTGAQLAGGTGFPTFKPPAMPAPQAAPQMPAPQGGGYAVPPAMSPATYQSETELGKEFGTKGGEQYQKAMQSLQSLYTMNADADKLAQTGGFTSPGAGADFRNNLAKNVNTVAGLLGQQPPFDPNAVASWESLTKNTKLMGMQVVSSMFGAQREAATIVNGATSAVPNAENTYLGFRLVSSGIEQSVARGMDLHAFVAQKLAANQPVSNAEVEFNQTHPVGVYTMRAIANAVPDEYVTALKSNPQSVQAFDTRFGNGVGEFILQGGRTGMGSVGQMPGAGTP